MISRHPFHRLVSAFRDKLEHSHGDIDPNEDFYFKTYGRRIRNKYRPLTIKKFGKEFISAENNFGAGMEISEGKRNKARITNKNDQLFINISYIVLSNILGVHSILEMHSSVKL